MILNNQPGLSKPGPVQDFKMQRFLFELMTSLSVRLMLLEGIQQF
jgi:hypothetical protein